MNSARPVADSRYGCCQRAAATLQTGRYIPPRKRTRGNSSRFCGWATERHGKFLVKTPRSAARQFKELRAARRPPHFERRTSRLACPDSSGASRPGFSYRGTTCRGSCQAPGHSWQCQSQRAGRRQRATRRAYRLRVRPSADPQCPAPVRQGAARRRTEPDGLGAGFNHHRPLCVVVSVGLVSPSRGRGEIAHIARSAQRCSHLHPDQRWHAQ